MEQTPLYIASVFDDMDDILLAWNQLFRGVCDSHAPLKEIKVRSVSSPWINNTIRLKMNRRFKLFKRAVETKGLFTWSGGPRSDGVGFFCFHALVDTKQKKPTPLDRGPPLHVNRV